MTRRTKRRNTIVCWGRRLGGVLLVDKCVWWDTGGTGTGVPLLSRWYGVALISWFEDCCMWIRLSLSARCWVRVLGSALVLSVNKITVCRVDCCFVLDCTALLLRIFNIHVWYNYYTACALTVILASFEQAKERRTTLHHAHFMWKIKKLPFSSKIVCYFSAKYFYFKYILSIKT